MRIVAAVTILAALLAAAAPVATAEDMVWGKATITFSIGTLTFHLVVDIGVPRYIPVGEATTATLRVYLSATKTNSWMTLALLGVLPERTATLAILTVPMQGGESTYTVDFVVPDELAAESPDGTMEIGFALKAIYSSGSQVSFTVRSSDIIRPTVMLGPASPPLLVAWAEPANVTVGGEARIPIRLEARGGTLTIDDVHVETPPFATVSMVGPLPFELDENESAVYEVMVRAFEPGAGTVAVALHYTSGSHEGVAVVSIPLVCQYEDVETAIQEYTAVAEQYKALLAQLAEMLNATVVAETIPIMEEVLNFTAETVELRRDLQLAMASHAAMAAAMDSLVDRLESVETNISNLADSLATLQGNISTIRQDLDSVESELWTVRHMQVDKLNSNLVNLESRIRDLENRLGSLERLLQILGAVAIPVAVAGLALAFHAARRAA